MILLPMFDLCSMQEFAVLVRWGAVRAEADVGKGRMSDCSQLSSPTTPHTSPTSQPTSSHTSPHPLANPLHPLAHSAHPLSHSYKQPSLTHRKETFKRSEVFPVFGGGLQASLPHQSVVQPTGLLTEHRTSHEKNCFEKHNLS